MASVRSGCTRWRAPGYRQTAVRFGARYSLTNNVSAGLEYNLRNRVSTPGLPDCTRQIIEVRVRGQS